MEYRQTYEQLLVCVGFESQYEFMWIIGKK